MKELGKSEYRLCKEEDIIPQSFNKSLKLANSWNPAIALYKICRNLGLSPDEVISGTKPHKDSDRIKQLTKENNLLRNELEREKTTVKKLKASFSILKGIK